MLTRFFATLLLALPLAMSTCTTPDRPLVDGFFNEEGIIYSDPEEEEWGTRSTMKVRGLEF